MNKAYSPEPTTSVPAGGLPVPSNQVTTKPRQMPGQGSGDNPRAGQVGSEESGGLDFNPESTGADTAPEEIQPKARKHSAYILSDIMAEVLADNPGLDSHQAYLISKRAVEEYGLDKEASEVWNPLAYGDRPGEPDGPLLEGVGWKKKHPSGVPHSSPSSQQQTAQPEHAERVLGEAPAGYPKAAPAGLPTSAPKVGPDTGHDIVKMVRDDDADGGWRMARREAVTQ